jgi:SacI restriction endonuclease
MARPINYHDAAALLSAVFNEAEADFTAGTPPTVPGELEAASDRLLSSTTQAYREALVGCALARLLDSEIDIRLPYVNQGENAYNGRTLDEQVVNPFLHEHEIPSTKGPFLSAFRRNVRFTPETRVGLRDKEGFDTMLIFLDHLRIADADKARAYLRFLLYGFVKLRDAATVTLLHVQRLSVEQYEVLIGNLLQIPSGGRLPVLLAVAMFQTLKQCFSLNWTIEWQGINVADRASDVGGDITVKSGGEIVLAVEVTERPIDRARVLSTFSTKVLRHGISDYLFFFASALPTQDARALARQYIGQGHDISFLPVKDWLVSTLGTVGPRCRSEFIVHFLALLRSLDVPAYLKLAWNAQIRSLLEPE